LSNVFCLAGFVPAALCMCSNQYGSLKICYSYNLNNKLRLYFTNPFFENQFEIGVFSQPDGSGAGEEADFEALNCLPALKLIRSTKLHLSTEPAFFAKRLP